MRIQSGSAAGRELASVPKDLYVRPILARIKKSLFDILRPRIVRSRFLDVYAGTGAVGLEALSCGAQEVVFVESHRACVQAIERNLKRFGWENSGRVASRDATAGFSFLGGSFDILFLGPPYRTEDKRPLALTAPTLLVAARDKVLKEDGLAVAQHHAKEEITAAFDLWDMVRQEKYGDSRLSFFKAKKC